MRDGGEDGRFASPAGGDVDSEGPFSTREVTAPVEDEGEAKDAAGVTEGAEAPVAEAAREEEETSEVAPPREPEAVSTERGEDCRDIDKFWSLRGGRGGSALFGGTGRGEMIFGIAPVDA